MADHIIVLDSKPGRIKLEVQVELPVPRDRNSYEFLQVKKRIYEEFFEDEKIPEDFSI
ncbi:MAG: hypothetical protein J6N55_09310 [Anaerovibrio sp.]|uniref:hypothetical protein n=1 Tax=Anaerovibrio sp. TaxID=1872532 RepID=UPI001B1E0E67|nr:hypothetical protein [Anaerovibrio sp.]MBO6246463.1 hypothetical protein [Anaerovibrio sp.]